MAVTEVRQLPATIAGSALKLVPPTQKERAAALQHWMQEARRLHLAGLISDAEAYYSAVLKAQPGHVDAKHLLAVIRIQEGRLTEALRLLRQVVSSAPTLPPVHVNLGDALRLSGKLVDAIDSYDRAIALNPLYPEAHVNKGVTLSQLGRSEEAIAAFTTALYVKPGHIEALNNRGNCLANAGRQAEALADFELALKQGPQVANIHYNRANCLRALGRFDDALHAYSRAIELQPDYLDALNNRGNLRRELGKLEDALADLDEVLRLDPRNIVALNNRANVLRELGRTGEALATYESAAATSARGDIAYIYNNLGDTLSELGRFSEAVAAFQTATRMDPDHSAAFLNLASAHRFTPDDPLLTALVAARGRARTDADRARLDYALGKAHADLGDPATAFQFFASGAATRRTLLPYDEAATLAFFARIKAAFTADAIDRLRGAGDPAQRPVFILGMPRSGTSLIEQILASHPDVHGAGELTAMNSVLKPLASRRGEFPACIDGMDTSELAEIARQYINLTAPLAPTAARITDKMPLNFYFVGLIALAMPNARIIHVRRDPVDTCLSCFMQHFTQGHEFTNDLAELGRYWRAYDDLMTHWRHVLGDDAFRNVAYEDVVSDMESVARSLVDYIGLEWDDRCLQFHETQRAVRTASVKQVRQPIYTTSVERWRAYEPWIGPLLETLGRS